MLPTARCLNGTSRRDIHKTHALWKLARLPRDKSRCESSYVPLAEARNIDNNFTISLSTAVWWNWPIAISWVVGLARSKNSENPLRL